MKLLVVFCSTEPCGSALEAYLPLVKRSGAGLGIMDFSKTLGKDAEEANKMALKEVNKKGVPVYFFGQAQLEELTDKLSDPKLISVMLAPRLDYGWMRNKAYLLALASEAKVVQFFDIDTAPLERYPDILDVHWTLLQEAKMAAVSGSYYGPRQVTISMFKSVTGQVKFLRMLKEMTSFDVLDPLLIGGALAVNLDFARKVPFPMLPATTMSDDAILSYLAEFVGWRVQQSGELVDHQHGGKLDIETRQGKEWTKSYLIRLMRITALMNILTDQRIAPLLTNRLNQRGGNFPQLKETFLRPSEARLQNFLEKLFQIAKEESNELITEILSSLWWDEKMLKQVSIEIAEGMEEYANFLITWGGITVIAEKLGPTWVSL